MLESHNFYSMVQSSDNILLHKSDLGKTKPGFHRLPSPDFTYGKPTGEDQEDARDLMKKWKEHSSSKKPLPEHDYKMLNSLSVGNGLSTATQFRNYKKGNELRLHLSQENFHKKPFLPEMTHGKPIKNSTPIKSVITNFYGRMALENLNDCYAKSPKPKPSKWGNNKAFELFRSARAKEEVEKKERNFKMKKFLKVPNRTDCWRVQNS